MDWNETIGVERIGERRFTASVGEEWTSLQGAHGGVVAALAVSAAEEQLADIGVDLTTTTLRAATFGYARGNTIGDLEIDVEIVRRGRNMITTHVRTEQDDEPTTLVRLHHSSPWDGIEFSDIPAPGPRPEGTTRIALPPPAHLNNVETWLHPDTGLLAGTERAEWIAWSRPLHGGVFDSAWLVMYGDWFPPSVFSKVTAPVRAVTIEYSLQIHSAAGTWDLGDDGHLAARVHTTHAADGFAVEDAWFHLPDGTLLATARQTRLAG